MWIEDEVVGPKVGFDGFDVAGEYSISPIVWSAFGDVTGEGLELHPPGGTFGTIIVIPDADFTPEQLVGGAPGVAFASQVRRLAENKYRVIVPALIDRTALPRNGRAKLTNREFIYRSAFELGRHLIGYEVQKVLALVDLLFRERNSGAKPKIAVFGYGEGGAIALYAAALDPRIAAVCVSGYFGDRNDIWRQPVDRNVFGLLEQFGDAEVASLIAPRPLIVEAAKGPEVVIPPGTGGAPGRLTTPPLQTVKAEVEKSASLLQSSDPNPGSSWLSADRTGLVPSGPTLPSAPWSMPCKPDPSSTRPRLHSSPMPVLSNTPKPPLAPARRASSTSSIVITSSFWLKAPTCGASL